MSKKIKYFRITFCCSEDEQRAIERTAEACGLSTSKYCKLVILGHQPKQRLTFEDIALLQDVRKIKSDMERIANFFKNSNYQLLMEELRKVINRLKQLLYDCKG